MPHRDAEGPTPSSAPSLVQAERLGHRFESLAPVAVGAVDPAPIQRSGDLEEAKKAMERLQRSNQRALTDKRKEREEPFAQLNKKGLRFEKKSTPTQRLETGFGQATVSVGRGQGPRISTRKTDFSDKSVGDTYNEVIGKMVPAGTEESAVAQEVLDRMSNPNAPLQAISGDQQLNAATKLVGITQISEEKRNPGAAKLARAGLRLVAKKKRSFREVFGGDKALFVPARTGGTGKFRDMLAGSVDPEGEELFDELSESSGEESDG